MAKSKKGARGIVGLVCETCNSQNYITEKNRINTTEAMKIKKYCSQCKKTTIHKEKKKLH